MIEIPFAQKESLFQGETLEVKSFEHGVHQLLFKRAEKRNSFNAKMIEEINEALRILATISWPQDLRALLICGEGKVYSAGADLSYMKEQAKNNEAVNFHDAKELGRMFYRLAALPVPVISAVQGAAIGGGLGLTVCSDYVVAEENAIFATSEVRLGIVPGVISPYIVRKVGTGNASPFMLMGQQLRSPEAKQVGLVQQVCEKGQLQQATIDVLHEFLKAGPFAARTTKELILKASPLPAPKIFEYTALCIAGARCSEEGQSGLNAFFDKKPAPWVIEQDKGGDA